MSEPHVANTDLVISHLLLRKLVGLIGMLLPFALLFGNGVFSSASPPESISGYYYTDMRSFLVAGLCALGVLLMVYRGYRTMDGVLTNVAGSCVILVALFPTKPPLAVGQHFTSQQNVLGDLHVIFAAVAFIALGVIALRFAVTRPVSEVVIHRVCACMIFSSVLLGCLWGLTRADAGLLFVIEVIAMCSSGASWCISGRAAKAGVPSSMMSGAADSEIMDSGVGRTQINPSGEGMIGAR